MQFSQFEFYRSSWIEADGDDWTIVVNVAKIDDRVNKAVPVVHRGVAVRKTSTGK